VVFGEGSKLLSVLQGGTIKYARSQAITTSKQPRFEITASGSVLNSAGLVAAAIRAARHARSYADARGGSQW